MSEEIREENRPLTPEEMQAAIAREYEHLSQVAPARDVQLPKEEGSEVKTLGDVMAATEDMTDLQYAIHRMFPSVVENNSAMVGRIDPNVYIPILHIMSVDEIMCSDPNKPIDVDKIWMKNNIILSIGLDGMGRIDIAELLGAAREEKKAERLLRAGGI